MEVKRQYISIKNSIHYKGNDMTRKKIPTIKILLQTTGGSKWSFFFFFSYSSTGRKRRVFATLNGSKCSNMVVRMTISKQDLE